MQREVLSQDFDNLSIVSGLVEYRVFNARFTVTATGADTGRR